MLVSPTGGGLQCRLLQWRCRSPPLDGSAQVTLRGSSISAVRNLPPQHVRDKECPEEEQVLGIAHIGTGGCTDHTEGVAPGEEVLQRATPAEEWWLWLTGQAANVEKSTV